MSAKANQLSPIQCVPALPTSVMTKHGVVFDPRQDEWSISDIVSGKISFQFRHLEKLSLTFIRKLKLALVHFATTSSESHLRNIGERFWAFYRSEIASSDALINTIQLQHLLNYRARLDLNSEWKLGMVRILLLDMEALGYGVCTDEAARFLQDSTIKGNIKGTSVRTRDPQEGAFKDDELLSIQAALNDAYVGSRIDLPTFAMAWLFLAYGARSVQIAALKQKDLIVGTDTNGARFYALRIPRAKQHGERTRDSFKTRYCSKQIGRLIELVIEENRSLKNDPEIEDDEWPLFVSGSKGDVPGLSYHWSSKALALRLKTVLGRLAVKVINHFGDEVMKVFGV